MIRLHTTLLLVVLFALPGFAQEKFIKYHNDSEKAAISALGDYKASFKLALLANMPETDAQVYVDKVDAFITGLNWANEASGKPEKKLKPVFNQIHAHFLKKYEHTASFDQIFSSGTYQCVNASILYAYILESLKIPYQIKEMPTHVYVVAYPDQFNIMIETTDPTKGYYVPTEKGKETYIKDLIKSKYLEQAYVDKTGVDKAFNEFFYGKSNISFKEAVGLLYYNKFVSHAEKQEFADAYSDIYKANVLYPAKKHEFQRVAMLAELIRNFKFEQMHEWEALTMLVNSETSVESNDYLKFKFFDAMTSNLFRSSLKAKNDSVYNFIYANLKDASLKRDIEDQYLQETARFLYLAGKLDEARDYAEQGVIKNPKNPLMSSMLIDCILRKGMSSTGSVQNLKNLDAWSSKYDFIKTNVKVRSFYLYNYAFLSATSFEKEQLANGEKYYKLMVTELNSFNDHQDKNQTLMGMSFSGAVLYYFTKNQKQKVADAIAEGKKHCGEDPMFQQVVKGKSKLLSKM
ncbi:MAG TPA: hypothetical protein VKB19_08505 [Pedobacter sp.]|nr:hypothetical protein [Pedobacter sp.]